MRIAILSCFHPYRGGIAQFNASLLGELGRTCEVRAFNFKRQYPDILFPGKTQYVTEEDEAVPVESTAITDTVNPFSWFKTAREIRKWKSDVLIMRYWMPWFAPSLGTVAHKMGKDCKVIGILDNVIPHEQHIFDKPLTKYFLSGLDGCVTLCDDVEAELLKLMPDARHTVIPHPVYSHFGEKIPREEAEEKLWLEKGRKNILFFGLIREYKGLDILLEAFEKLPEDYQLIIAGEPYGSFEKYDRIIKNSRSGDRVHLFPDYIRDSEVKIYFSAADVVVLPYRNATQSGVSAIADNFEVPMIVTDVGGLKQTIGDTGKGLVVSVPTPEAIASMIERYFADTAIREACIASIRKENDRLSWNNFVAKLLDFIQSL